MWNEGPERYAKKDNLEDILRFADENPENVHLNVTRAEQVFGDHYQRLVGAYKQASTKVASYLRIFYDYASRFVKTKADKLLNVIDYLMGQVGPVNIIDVDKDVMGSNLLGMTFPNQNIPPIFLNSGQGTIGKLETTVHELLHIKRPDLPEMEIRKLAAIYCNV